MATTSTILQEEEISASHLDGGLEPSTLLSNDKSAFRNYGEGVQCNVQRHYRNMRIHQTVDYVKCQSAKHFNFSHPMLIWDAMEALNSLIDSSDPDLDLPNIQHLFQSAEAMRVEGRPDWMMVTALLHDLGKNLYLWGSEEEGTGQHNQFGLVGDTFVVGCRIPKGVLFPEFNELNPDMHDERYNTDLGMYSPHCGLENLTLAFGHDEYMYQVLKNHATCTLPQEALWMIRFHSFYPWHKEGEYAHLLLPSDVAIKEAVLDFNKYDLYSKSRECLYDLDEMKTRYLPLLEKYLGAGPILF